MITPAQRADFVWKNFFLIYKSPVPVGQITLGYGTDYGETVFIPDLSGNYFDKKEIPDSNDFVWKEINGIRIPFLFSFTGKDFFTIENERVVFNTDIVSSVFFFLSGWQELVNTNKDYLGRFTYEHSIQKKLDILHVPIVHYYFEILKQAIETACHIHLENKLLSKGKFITCPTHDIDIWATLWKKEIKYALRKFQLVRSISLFITRLKNHHYPKSFEKISTLQQQYGFKSDFFFLPSQTSYKDQKNADYDILNPRYNAFIKNLALLNPVNLHGSFMSGFNENNLKSDLDKIPASAKGYRSHYLMFDMGVTPRILEKRGFEFDSTLGFNSHPGFRNGTAYPFYLYNFNTNTATSVIEIPHIVMEVSLFYDHYLGLYNAEQALSYLKPMLKEFIKTGGCLTLNWHNDTFAALGREEWQKTLELILEFSQQNEGAFLTCEQVVNLIHDT